MSKWVTVNKWLTKAKGITAHPAIPLAISMASVAVSLQAYQLSSHTDARSLASDRATAQAVAMARLMEFEQIESAATQHRLMFSSGLIAKDFRSALSSWNMHFALDGEFFPKIDMPLEELEAIGRVYPDAERAAMKCKTTEEQLLSSLNDARTMLNQGVDPNDPNMISAQIFLGAVFDHMRYTIKQCEAASDKLAAIADPGLVPDHAFAEKFEKLIELEAPRRFKLADSIAAFRVSSNQAAPSH